MRSFFFAYQFNSTHICAILIWLLGGKKDEKISIKEICSINR